MQKWLRTTGLGWRLHAWAGESWSLLCSYLRIR